MREYYEIRPYFGTTIWVHCFYKDGIDIAGVANACWAKAESIQQNLNVHSVLKEGNLSWLNALGVEGVRVHEDLFKILKRSIEYARLTDGAYDMTIFPLVQLWKNAAVNNRLPDQDSIDIAKAKVGYQHLRFEEPNKVFFMKKGMMVDLGSPASGYFCDEVAHIMEVNGIEHFMVDGGGEIFCRGLNKGEFPWKVGVQDPFNKDKVLMDMHLHNKGVSTSGDYEKFTTIGNERFAHIIDPRTGYPQKGAASVTVIADTTQAANELSTALCVMGGQKGIEFVRTLNFAIPHPFGVRNDERGVRNDERGVRNDGSIEALIVENVDGKTEYFRTDGFII